MKHRIIILTFLAAVAASAADRPNLIFFLSDDQRADFLGCAGHPILKTPNIDKLAARGVRFENMFVTTSICAASRASILTGLHERTHRFTFGTPAVRQDYINASYPLLMRKAGYRTGHIGKFGVRVPKGATAEMYDYYRPHGRGPVHPRQGG